MENYKNGVGVNMDMLDSGDSSWFLRYIQQQKVKSAKRIIVSIQV
jgi:hypothetical protein